MPDKKPTIKPLLYIEQPSLIAPKASMQQNYQSPKTESKDFHTKHEERQVARSRYFHRRHAFQSEDQIRDLADEDHHKEEEDLLVEKKDWETPQADKKFVDMNVEEKIAYFLNRSSYTPTLRCEIQTDERNHRGVITDLKDQEVIMRIGRGAAGQKIPVNKIKDIRLLGF